jgi:soluble lytic murein transglycosylase-like protein
MRAVILAAVAGLAAWALLMPGTAAAAFSLPALFGVSMDAIRRRAGNYLPLIHAAENARGIPRDLLTRLLYTESAFRPEVIDGRVKSRTGAVGIAQILPSTARDPGYGVPPIKDPTDPQAAIPWAAHYLRAMYDRTGSWAQALGAYNQGLGAVLKARQAGGANWLAHMPAEGRHYVAGITADVPVA